MAGELTKEERVRIYGEVFTPQKIVDQMCDMLQAEAPDCFDPEKTFLEPCAGEGVFVLEILRRKFARCRSRADYTTAIRSVWGMEIQPQNVEACIAAVEALVREYIKPTKAELEAVRDHIILADSLKVMRMIGDLDARGVTEIRSLSYDPEEPNHEETTDARRSDRLDAAGAAVPEHLQTNRDVILAEIAGWPDEILYYAYHEFFKCRPHAGPVLLLCEVCEAEHSEIPCDKNGDCICSITDWMRRPADWRDEARREV